MIKEKLFDLISARTAARDRSGILFIAGLITVAAFDVRRSAAGFCKRNKKIQADSPVFARAQRLSAKSRPKEKKEDKDRLETIYFF